MQKRSKLRTENYFTNTLHVGCESYCFTIGSKVRLSKKNSPFQQTLSLEISEEVDILSTCRHPSWWSARSVEGADDRCCNPMHVVSGSNLSFSRLWLLEYCTTTVSSSSCTFFSQNSFFDLWHEFPPRYDIVWKRLVCVMCQYNIHQPVLWRWNTILGSVIFSHRVLFENVGILDIFEWSCRHVQDT